MKFIHFIAIILAISSAVFITARADDEIESLLQKVSGVKPVDPITSLKDSVLKLELLGSKMEINEKDNEIKLLDKPNEKNMILANQILNQEDESVSLMETQTETETEAETENESEMESEVENQNEMESESESLIENETSSDESYPSIQSTPSAHPTHLRRNGRIMLETGKPGLLKRMGSSIKAGAKKVGSGLKKVGSGLKKVGKAVWKGVKTVGKFALKHGVKALKNHLDRRNGGSAHNGNVHNGNAYDGNAYNGNAYNGNGWSSQHGYGVGSLGKKVRPHRPAPRLTGAASRLTRSNVRCVLCQYILQKIHADLSEANANIENGGAKKEAPKKKGDKKKADKAVFIQTEETISNGVESESEQMARISSLVAADAEADAMAHPQLFNHGPMPSNRYRSTTVNAARPAQMRFKHLVPQQAATADSKKESKTADKSKSESHDHSLSEVNSDYGYSGDDDYQHPSVQSAGTGPMDIEEPIPRLNSKDDKTSDSKSSPSKATPSHNAREISARAAYQKLYTSVYASFETLCARRMPLAYLPYCNDMLRSYRYFAQGIHYGDRPETICMNGNFCDKRSYIRNLPHVFYQREAGDA